MSENIFRWLKDSSYGTFKKIVKNLWPNEAVQLNIPSSNSTGDSANATTTSVQEIKLPKIIVVGSEKSGKSTVLEAITLRKFFPRHFRLCTKCPILLQMSDSETISAIIIWDGVETVCNNDEEISAKVQEIMDSLLVQTDKLLTIKITGPELPNFELIDLPGLICIDSGEGIKERIDAMVDHFNDPDTLILCVVPASTSALNSNLAVAKVKAMNKLDKTILCLTMCDQVQDPEMMRYCVLDRILRKEELQKEGLTGFAGVVATANLHKTRDIEQRYFDEMFDALPSSLLPLKPSLMGNCMSTNIIRVLDRLFHGHIEQEWCPNVLNGIQAMINTQDAQLKLLGTDPVSLTPLQIWQEVRSRLSEEIFLNATYNAVKTDFDRIKPTALIAAGKHETETPFALQEVVHSRDFQKKIDEICQLFTENRHEGVSALRLLVSNSIRDEIINVFDNEENPDLMISRFEHFQGLLSRAIQQKMSDSVGIEADEALFMTSIQFTSAHISTTLYTYADLWKNLQHQSAMILASRAKCITDSIEGFVTGINGNNLTTLQETEAIARKRQEFLAQLRTLKDQYQNIENLKEFIR
jgi:GTPase SAR1 family protein